MNPKNTIENVRYLEVQHVFNNPQNKATVSSTQKIQNFKMNPSTKNTPLIPVCKYAKSSPWVNN